MDRFARLLDERALERAVSEVSEAPFGAQSSTASAFGRWDVIDVAIRKIRLDVKGWAV